MQLFVGGGVLLLLVVKSCFACRGSLFVSVVMFVVCWLDTVRCALCLVICLLFDGC